MKQQLYLHPQFSEFIRSLRKACGIKSETIANALGISQSQYSKTENGMKPFSETCLKKMAGMFQMEEGELLNRFRRYLNTADTNRADALAQIGRRKDELDEMEKYCRHIINKPESMLDVIESVRNEKHRDSGSIGS